MDLENYLEQRSCKISERLSLLSDYELEKFRKMTCKKEERVAKRLGLDTSSWNWRLVSLDSLESNAFIFLDCRISAQVKETIRRHSFNHRHQPHYAPLRERYS